MEQTTIQTIKVFESEIDESMTKRQILKVFSKLDNVTISRTRTQRGRQAVRVQRGSILNGERYNIMFHNDALHVIDYEKNVPEYKSAELRRILGEL